MLPVSEEFPSYWLADIDDLNEVADHHFDLPSLYTTLSGFQSSLELIELDATSAATEHRCLFRAMYEWEPFGSFENFDSLKELIVSAEVLRHVPRNATGEEGFEEEDDDDWDRTELYSLLPPSLERLTIRGKWDRDLEKSLIEFADSCGSAISLLSKFSCPLAQASQAVAQNLVMRYRD